jgi:CysZ protein
MLAALSKAFAQLPDPRLRGVVAWSVALSVAALLALAFVARLVIGGMQLFEGDAWNTLASWVGTLLVMGVSLMLFPATVQLIGSLFSDRVADAVESRHYPAMAASARSAPLSAQLGSGLRLFLLAVVLNILLLPIYIFVPGLNLLLYYGLNGYLLGREYFEQTAFRHLPAGDVKAAFRRHRFRAWAAGVVIAAVMTIPVLNLASPVLATAFMIHIFRSMQSMENKR